MDGEHLAAHDLQRLDGCSQLLTEFQQQFVEYVFDGSAFLLRLGEHLHLLGQLLRRVDTIAAPLFEVGGGKEKGLEPKVSCSLSNKVGRFLCALNDVLYPLASNFSNCSVPSLGRFTSGCNCFWQLNQNCVTHDSISSIQPCYRIKTRC